METKCEKGIENGDTTWSDQALHWEDDILKVLKEIRKQNIHPGGEYSGLVKI